MEREVTGSEAVIQTSDQTQWRMVLVDPKDLRYPPPPSQDTIALLVLGFGVRWIIAGFREPRRKKRTGYYESRGNEVGIPARRWERAEPLNRDSPQKIS
jgi:hypothetical protein